MRPGGRRRRLRWVAAVAMASILAGARPVAAHFGDHESVGGNVLSTATLETPALTEAMADPLECTVSLVWIPPATGPLPDGYLLYRSTSSGGSYTFVKRVGPVTATTDTGLSPATTYHYVLRSTLSNWWSGDSNARSATTAPLCL